MLYNQFTRIIALGLALFISLTTRATTYLAPTAPVIIINSGTITMPPVVSGTPAGFMTTVPSASYRQANFSSNNGATWTSPAAYFANSNLPMWVSGTSTGFMSTFIVPGDGIATGAPAYNFSTDQGNTWNGFPHAIVGAGGMYSPVSVSGTSAGFMAVWRNGGDNNAYSSFSSDNGATWSTPVNISSSGSVNSAVIVSGTENGFMVTWRQSSGSGSAHAAFSTNHGATWTSTDVLASTGVTSDVWVAGNSRGFMATWIQNTELFTSYNVLGESTWSDPIPVIISLSGAIISDAAVAAAESGFIVTFIDPSDTNAYAIFYSEIDATWSDAVQINTTVHASVGNIADAGNGKGFVSVCAVGDTCMFAWLGTDGKTYSSFSNISPGAISAPATISGSQKKNDFGLMYELFNSIQWAPSSSSWISGYYVYKNNVLIASLPSSATSYQDHNQPQTSTNQYSIEAFDKNGNTSFPLLLRFTNGIAHQIFVG